MYKKKIIFQNCSIQETMKKMDSEKVDSLIVVDSLKRVKGIFTISDFRRSIFFGLDIDEKIKSIINKNFKYLKVGYSKNEAKKIFFDNDLIFEIPVLNKKQKLIEIINRSSFLPRKKNYKKNYRIKNIPVVIMAGGKGKRLDPYTRIIPKPLIPIGNNPIIRNIMDNFIKNDFKKFYVSINEKGEMIKSYFKSFKNSYNINYVHEKKPLGTIGSLKLLKKKLKNSFFVTNSDILILSHYKTIMEFHLRNNFDLTIIVSMRNYNIPYGVCNFDKDGKLQSINEKPKFNFFVNTGMYVVKSKLVDLIPSNQTFDMNELIEKAQKNNANIGVFPISENSWKDVGQLSEYKKYI